MWNRPKVQDVSGGLPIGWCSCDPLFGSSEVDPRGRHLKSVFLSRDGRRSCQGSVPLFVFPICSGEWISNEIFLHICSVTCSLLPRTRAVSRKLIHISFLSDFCSFHSLINVNRNQWISWSRKSLLVSLYIMLCLVCALIVLISSVEFSGSGRPIIKGALGSSVVKLQEKLRLYEKFKLQ